MKNKRRVIASSVIVVILSSSVISGQSAPFSYSAPSATKDGIKTGTLKDAGLDETGIIAATNKIINGAYGNIHSFLIVRDGRLVHEAYFKGEDIQRGKGRLGVVDHGIDTLHDLRSISKTIVGAAVLVAHTNGKIKSLDQSIFDYLPNYASHAVGSKKEITIKHLLTMTAGLDWNEGMPYTNPANDETRLDGAPDPVEFFLARKSVEKPGVAFNYSAGATETLAAIVKNATGQAIDAYIAEQIFKPLGITQIEWAKRANGSVIVPSGLRLRSRDLVKFGMLYLDRGKWNGKQIIKPELIDDAVKVHVVAPFPIPNGGSVAYGYQIWRPTLPSGPNELMPLIMAQGNGGQLMILDFDRRAVVVFTAAQYDSSDMSKSPDAVYAEFVYPTLKKASSGTK